MIDLKKIETEMARLVEIAGSAGTPFAAMVLDRKGQAVEQGVNSSAQDGPVAHAELNVLKAAGRRYGRLDGYSLITTCEPCPMCMSAAIWCRVERVYFGVSIDTAVDYIPQIMIHSKDFDGKTFHMPEVYGGILTDECEKLFEQRFKCS